MSEPFKVAVAGPSRVGKTTLVTAILSDTEDMLAGTPVSIVADEKTAARLRTQKNDLRKATAAGVFNAASLGGTQSMSHYEVMLQADGDLGLQVPFRILDYPGRWLNPEQRKGEALELWPQCEAHIKQSIMLLIPIDAAVLMEAATPAQRSAVPDLLGVVDVEEIALKWAKARAGRSDEPAVVVLAPLKCEKYFDDNGGNGHEAPRLEQQVAEIYQETLRKIRQETDAAGRDLKVIYAPIDTYGCVQLMEAEWPEVAPGELDFVGRYRFRGRPPQVKVKAAGTVMQELCKCIVSGEVRRANRGIAEQQSSYFGLLERKTEDKGFWGALGYYLGGEAWDNRQDRRRTALEISAASRQRDQLLEALDKLAATARDSRVKEW